MFLNLYGGNICQPIFWIFILGVAELLLKISYKKIWCEIHAAPLWWQFIAHFKVKDLRMRFIVLELKQKIIFLQILQLLR